MTLENLQSACAALKSGKVTERKRSAEHLIELLERDDICRNLDSNSVQRDKTGDKVTWTTLFKEVTEHFSKETEKLTGNKVTKGNCFSVVERVFEKGTSRRPWINWSKIFDFTTGYLSRDAHAMVYGSGLVQMLQNFLSIEHYVSVIDANSWIDLIKLLLKLYANRKYDNNIKLVILECLYLCIQEGSNHPIVIATLRSDVVQFFENIFATATDKIENLSVILRGITSLCRKNAVEFRGILCKLGEYLVPKILNNSSIYPRADEKSAIFELLLVQVQIHSPCDTSLQNVAAFYASDSRKWPEILKSIYSFCLEALGDIASEKQKNSSNNKELQVSDRLLLLAAKCTKFVHDGQTDEHSSSGDEDDNPNPAKKPMKFRSFHNVLSDICSGMVPGESQIVWLNYLTAVFTQFPLLVDTRISFSSLFQLGNTLLKSTFVTRRDVYLYLLCLLNTEKILIDKEVLKCRSKSWENVWDLTIRSLSVSEFKTEALELLRKILIQVQPSNVHSLLLLYTSGTLPVTPASLNLLAEYLSRCSLPLYLGSSTENQTSTSSSLAIDIEIASTSCPRSALIRWLMTSSTASGKQMSTTSSSSSEHECQDLGLGHEPLISTILCSLLVRQTHNLIIAEKFCCRPNTRMRLKIPSELTQFESVYEDFEKMLLKCCFVQLPSSTTAAYGEDNNNINESSSEPPEVLKLSLIPIIPGRLVESLMEDYEKMPQFDYTDKSSDFLKRFTQLNFRVAVYLNALNVLEKYNIGIRGGDDFGFRTSLEKLFDKALSRLVECTTDFITKGRNKTAEDVQKLIVIVRNILKSYQLCDGVKVMLAQRFPQQLQELLKKAYRSNLVRYIERAANNPSDTLMFSSSDIAARFISAKDDDCTDCRQIELAALESLGCLIDYGIICDHRVDLFSDILRDCINETYNSNIPFIFEFSSELITRLIPPLNSSRGREYTDVLTMITNLLQKMCKGFYTIPQCSARLWELFSDITALTARDSDVNKKNLMILIGTLSGFMKTKTPHGSSILVCQAGFKTLNELAKNDPQMEWSVFLPKSGAECWVLTDAYEFLKNPSHQIRLFATETICTTYESAAPLIAVVPDYVPRITSRPLSLADYFEKIYQLIQNTFAISPNLTPDENAEESMNRTCIALACLTRLVFAYPFIQKKSLFSLLHLVKTKSLEISLTYRALVYASPTAAKTMCCHVSFLLHKWLTSDYPIDEFPYQFFGLESMNHFYNEFQKEISVEFFQKNETEGLEKFANFFGKDPLDLIKDCFGMLMARIVPGVAIYKSTNQSSAGRDIAQLQELHNIQKRLNSTLGGKTQTESLMMTRLDDVVMQSVSLVFDPNIPAEWGCPTTFQLPEPSTPYYDENSVDTGLNFLKEASSRKDFSLIAILALHNPKAIYDTLLTLINRVHNAHDALEKFWRLHQFSYFLKQLLKEKPPIFNKMKEYVCQFVVFGYIRLLNGDGGSGDYSKYFRESLVHLISQLVLTLTFTYPEEMKEHYYTIVNNLVVSVVKHPDLLEAAKKPLDTLLIRYETEFADCIVTLNPFPTNKIAEFEKYKDVYLRVKYGQVAKPGSPVRGEWNLFQELKSYLPNPAESWTLERLQWIRELLNQKKRDVDKLVRHLEGKRLSDMCQSEVLHALIQILLNVIKNGEDDDLVQEAARCLGEIGPVDLSVLVLPNYNSSKREIKGMGRSLTTIIEILVDYLKSDDMNLVTTSGEVLRALCRTTECTELIDKDFAKSRTEVILKPFKVGQDEATIPKTPEKVYPNAIETKLGLNEMNEFVDYNSWIIQLTCGLIECFKEGESVISSLLAVCRIKVEFCQEILPFVFYVLLFSGRSNPLVRKTVSGYFRNFFNKCIHNLSGGSDCSRSFTPVMGSQYQISIFTNKLAIRSLIGVVQFLRLHPAPQEYKGSSKISPWDSNFWLDISYFDMAKAAQHCGAYLTSILFTEIAVTEVDTGLNSSHVEDSGEEDMDAFYSQGAALIPTTRGGVRGECYELLLKAYTNIGEPDAVYGCGSARFSDGMMNISHLQQRMQFFRVLSASDGNAVDSNSPTKAGVGGSLKDLGLYNTLWTYLKGIEMEDQVLDHDLAEIQYECGWRLSKWNLHCDKATYLKDGSFFENSRSHGMLQRFVYESVQTGLAKDVVNHVQNVARGYKSVSRNLRHASIESSENLYGFLSQFQMLRVVEDFFEEELKSGSVGIGNFLQRWRTHDKISPADFKFQEPVLSLRCVLLHSYDQRNPSSKLETAYDDSMLEILSKARDCGRLEFAENCANSISSQSDRSLKKDLEIAKNHWARGDQDIARHILGKLIKKNPDGCELYPNMLLLHGEWLSESMSERPTVILEKYLSRSCQIFEKRGPAGLTEGAKAQFVLAKYADDQYQNCVKYMKSDLYSEKIAHLQKAKQDLAAVASSMDIDVRRSASTLKKQSIIDQDEINATTEEKKKFLLLALRHYLKGLKDSNEQDLLVFRAVALWLENADSVDDPKFSVDVNKTVEIEVLPSYKYVVVLHQLSARLSASSTSSSSNMASNISNILYKCAEQHPYHTLPVLLTQSLLHQDQIVTTGKNSAKKKQQISEDRVAAANKLVDGLKRHKTLGAITNKMGRLWEALIQLANVQESSSRNVSSSSVLIPNNSDIKKLMGLEIVPIPTATLSVSPSGEYTDIVGIQGFEPQYGLVGGINSPKRITCVGTNGLKFNMLLKGQDDLRQDAVMQQVFCVMNKLLQNESKTKTRKLHVRTYKVVPLSQRTGVLEWCENTQTFGDYLIGSKDSDGAHQKYRPTDYTPMECRIKMSEVKECGDNEKKYSTFMAILEHFKPVFRHFFFENFKEAGAYFERRLAYTRSVATNSMVGYILGLGDRHVLNILVDKTTAELIHIDLGVAFEQGRILPSPETIPFRLTRDIVDGMGVSGVEGVYRKSCEMTLEVLRNNSEVILTILEVLLYDPLYMWTLTADRVRKVQPTDSNQTPIRKRSIQSSIANETGDDAPKARNNSAARVLLRLRQKLAGVEEEVGTSASALSVPGHVSLLIQRAMDPEKLSRLFPGWQPYL